MTVYSFVLLFLKSHTLPHNVHVVAPPNVEHAQRTCSELLPSSCPVLLYGAFLLSFTCSFFSPLFYLRANRSLHRVLRLK